MVRNSNFSKTMVKMYTRMLPKTKVNSSSQTTSPDKRRALKLQGKQSVRVPRGGACAFPEKMNKNNNNNNNKENEDTCKICDRQSNTAADDRYDSMWVQCCRTGCRYWVHVKCLGFWGRGRGRDNSGRYNEFLDTINMVDYFCPRHRPSSGRGNILRASVQSREGHRMFIQATDINMYYSN